MWPALITLLVILGIVLLLAFWLIIVYNGLVVSRNRFKNAFAQIDVQLKRRYDLIPNLVETVKDEYVFFALRSTASRALPCLPGIP